MGAPSENGSAEFTLPSTQSKRDKKKTFQPTQVLRDVRTGIEESRKPKATQDQILINRGRTAIRDLPRVGRDKNFRADLLALKRLVLELAFGKNNPDAASMAFREMASTVSFGEDGEQNLGAINDWMDHQRGVAAIVNKNLSKMDREERMEFNRVLGTLHGRMQDTVGVVTAAWMAKKSEAALSADAETEQFDEPTIVPDVPPTE